MIRTLLPSNLDQGKFVSPPFYSQVMTTKRRKRISGLVCPGCSEIGTLRKIVYGMPDPESFDFEKYAVGGCCMNGDGSDPDIRCRHANGRVFEPKLLD